MATVRELLQKGQYGRVADFLATKKLDDDVAQKRLNNQIISLRRQQDVQNSILNHAGENRDAVAFRMAMENKMMLPGTDDEPNQYTKKYQELLNNLGGTDSNWIQIEFEGKTEKRTLWGIDWLAKDVEHEDDAFDLFVRQNHFDPNDFKNDTFNYRLENVDGRTRLSVRKGSDNFLDIIRGLRNVDDNHTIKGGKIDEYVDRDNARYSFRGLKEDSKGHLTPTGASFSGSTSQSFKEAIPFLGGRSVDRDVPSVTGEEFANPDYTNNESVVTLRQINEFVDDVFDTAKESAPQYYNPEEKDVLQGTTVSSFMSAADEFAFDALTSGTIELSEYKSLKDYMQQLFEEDLVSTGLAQYNIYATDSDDDNRDIMRKLDTKERTALTDIVSAAKQKKLLTFKAAICGDRVGTLVTIDATFDEKTGEPKTKGKTFFIENWRNDSAENVFNNDTKTRALLEYNSMRSYDYGATVKDGYISSATNDGAILTKNDGTNVTLSPEEVQWHLNQQYIIEDGIKIAQQSFYNEDGSRKNTPPDILTDVNRYALTAVTELYPQAAQELDSESVNTKTNATEFLESKARDLAAYILKSIGYEQ